jgi:Flp pilus assembly protein TadD
MPKSAGSRELVRPPASRAWVELGRAHAMAGDVPHAVRCFEHALQVDLRCADAWDDLGTALQQLGQRARERARTRCAASWTATAR